MATAVRKGFLMHKYVLSLTGRNPRCLHNVTRRYVQTDTGALLEEPKKTQFGLIKVILSVIPGLYLGATLSKEGAAFLEENDIFVPDDDDD